MYDMSKIDSIMLRYRPIAPKPAVNSSGSGSTTVENSSTYVKTGRKKRCYVRNSKKNDSISSGSVTKRSKCKSGGRKRKSSSPEENDSNGRRSRVSTTGSVSGGDGIITLPLLPESPERKEENSQARGSSRGSSHGSEKVPLWLNFGSQQDGTVPQEAVRVVGTWVMVECITETWVGGVDVYGGEWWSTDVGSLMNLERDTCPWLISDGANRVTWVNRAYREMVGGQDEEVSLSVWIVMKEGLELQPRNWAAFTCRVRVVTCGKGKSSITLDCDVWRMDGGHGFAWRLDTKAALSLGP